jgi:ubiquinone/menaquinone biosynthesis C-methylase UbiE
MQKLNTIITSLEGKKETFHHFAPILALSIALENGLPIERKIFDKIIFKLNKVIEEGYVKWSKNYPYDYDDTLIVRKVCSLIEQPIKDKIKLSFSDNGGVFTYVGGLKSKSNNNVDILINLIILDYLIKSGDDNKSKEQLIYFLKENKSLFKNNIEELSKYYLSEGYFIYLLSKVCGFLDVDIESIINSKIKKVNNKTDFGFLILSSAKPSKLLLEKFKKANKQPIQLFQHPRLKLKFSCDFLDYVVRESAEIKIKNVLFDKDVAKIYNKIKNQLYEYEKSAKNLTYLLKKYDLENKKLIELGVGTANLCTFLLKRGYQILGVDISKDMLNIAKDKTKNYNVNYVIQDIKNLNIEPSKVIYAHNFIDFLNGGIEIWADNSKDAIKILKSISKTLQKNGFLFIHKKEPKKQDKNYKLLNKRILKDNKIINIYLYKDNEIVMRKKYEKSYISYPKFKEIIKNLGLKFFDENESWFVLKKTISAI